jgi:hypothetical protein
VISGVLVAKGVFRGVGRIVELPDLPTDPPNFSRDDLVFSEGTMHLVSAPVAITSFLLNRHNCLFRLTLQQTGEVRGGIGRFAAAAGSFTSTVSGQGLGARDPDGSCSTTLPTLHEVDRLASSGTLSF